MNIKRIANIFVIMLLLFSIYEYQSLNKKISDDIEQCKMIFNDFGMSTRQADLKKYLISDEECCTFQLENNEIKTKCKTRK